MTTLTILPEGLRAEVEAGTNLLQAILAAGGKLVSQCGGGAKCGACHLFVTEGRKGLSKLTPAENAKLDTLVGVGSKSRLACQATVLGTEAVTVELLGALSG
ncbi:MAG: (2Fe-2S)-binding protein [Piscinibacter sp.]|nr:(2Fe-2S)-binding protein [Piscinibacter sp.]